ncbi:MAG: metal ABC transporter ATP-binding protein [Fimbriimonadaceae bacterium]|nr:metal ABC transporter ATP-binding protein [Fimbriimonadaceae bacterium]
MSEAVVVCDNVQFAYGLTPVLRGVHFEVSRGQFVGLIGPNGCGKSTVMRLLLGLLEPTAGQVSVLGGSALAAVRRGDVGYVPQRETFQRSFPLTVGDVVLMGRAGRIGLGQRACRHDHERVTETLERLGLGGWETRRFAALSGGQQRLVLLARALAQQPRLLLMDEADTGLDELRRERVYRELNRVREERDLSIIAISHQLDLLATVVDTALALRDGRSLDWCPSCMHHAIDSPQPAHLGPA